MALDTTVGGADAQSYVDTEYADDYFALTSRASAWAAITGAEGYLFDAMPYIETLNFMGSRATVAQALEFPRISTYECQPGTSAGAAASGAWTDKRGRVWSSDEIPEPVKQAQCEVALWLYQSGIAASTSARRVKQFTADGLSVTYEHAASVAALPLTIKKLLSAFVDFNARTMRA